MPQLCDKSVPQFQYFQLFFYLYFKIVVEAVRTERSEFRKKRTRARVCPSTARASYRLVTSHITEQEGRTREYWPEVGQYGPSAATRRLGGPYHKRPRANIPLHGPLAQLVSSLLHGTQAMLVLNLPAFENQKYTAYDRFLGRMAKSRPKTVPVRTLR